MNNDITVAANSPFSVDLLTGHRHVKILGGYDVSGITRNWPMYLLPDDGIYPSRAIFCGPNQSPLKVMEKNFTRR
jgi:hypothetical protein